MNKQVLKELAELRALDQISKHQFAEMLSKELNASSIIAMFLYNSPVVKLVYNYMKAYREEYNSFIQYKKAASEHSDRTEDFHREHCYCILDTKHTLHTLMTCDVPGSASFISNS